MKSISRILLVCPLNLVGYVEETQEETAPNPTKVVKKTSAKQKAARKIQKQILQFSQQL